MAKKRPRKKTRPKPTVLSVRCKPEIVEVLDEYVEHLRKKLPGGNWSRSSAALNLLATALEELSGKDLG